MKLETLLRDASTQAGKRLGNSRRFQNGILPGGKEMHGRERQKLGELGQGMRRATACPGNTSHENGEMRPEQQSRLQSQDKTRKNQLVLLSVLIVAVGLVGTLIWDLALQNEKVPGAEHNAVLGITIFIQAMIAFFGILNLEEPHTTKISPLTKGGMRSAIAGAMVVTYISLVIFHCMVEFSTGRSPTRDSFVNSFTGIINITIIFYFASEAAIHWINSMDKRRDAGQHGKVDS